MRTAEDNVRPALRNIIMASTQRASSPALSACRLCAVVVLLLPHLVRAVHVPAHFVEKFSVLSTKQADTAKLTCDAYGTRPISVTWLKQSPSGELSPLPLDGTRGLGLGGYGTSGSSYRGPGSAAARMLAFQKDFEDSDKRTVFELHILHSQLNDSALYVCKVTNEFGEDAHNIELTVLDVPSAPENVVIDGVWSRGVSVVWSAPKNNGNSPISQYVIQYWKNTSQGATTTAAASMSYSSVSSSSGGGKSSLPLSQQRLYEEVISSAVTSHVLRDKLSPGTAYSLRVLGSNQFGRGAPSSSVRLVTKEEAPDAPPIDISLEAGSTVVRIKWKAPPRTHWNGQLKGYNVGHRSVAAEDDGDRDLVVLSGDTEQLRRLYTLKAVPFTDLPGGEDYQQEYILTGLQKSSTHSIIIQAYNGAGNGPFSQQIIASTSSNDPPAVPALWVTGATENSIKLKWDLKRNSHELTHYVLYYKDDKSPWLEIAFPVPEDNTYELINLERGAWYQMYIRSVSKRGPSDPSEVLTIRTEGETLHGIIDIGRGGSNHAIGQQQQVPPYIHSLVVIPISVAVVVIVIACASAYAYVKFEERKTDLIKVGVAHILSQSPSNNFQYIGGSPTSSSTPSRATSIVSEEGTLTLRYSDSSGRPLLARPPVPTVLWAQQQGPILEESEGSESFPSPYATTMPMKRFTTFNPSPEHPPPKLPGLDKSVVGCRRTSHDNVGGLFSNSFVKAQQAPSVLEPTRTTSATTTTSSNLFCKADIHSSSFEDSKRPSNNCSTFHAASNSAAAGDHRPFQ